MFKYNRPNDSVHWYLNELASRVVAESGIPSDRYHLGKIIMQSFKDAPDYLNQIDGGTGLSETNSSVLERSIRCAISLQNLGLGVGDVIVLMIPNTVDLVVPFYAALYIGVAISGIDRFLGVGELKGTFEVTRPKVIFCLSEKAPEVQLALNELDLDAQIVIMDTGDYLCSFHEFLEKYGDETTVEDFRPSDFDAEEANAVLISTSGTTGLPKCAACTHKNFAISVPQLWVKSTQFPSPARMILLISPIQWLTAIVHILGSAILRYTRLQTSLPVTQDHIYDLVNEYKPSHTIISPTLMTTLINPADRDRCDFTCFEQILMAGSAVPTDLLQELRELLPDTEVFDAYGMTELTCVAVCPDNPPLGSSGKPVNCFFFRIINPETLEDVTEPFVHGELWVKGPSVFKEYYNNPEATEETFAEDRWFKTGDLFYRDENWYLYFVERLKLLLKYRSNQISPVEIEGVIRTHPGVLDAAVTGIPDPECGDLPVAFVVPKSDCEVTAEDIKNLVQESLADFKQLRGGVIFINEIPLTATGKLHRRRLKEMALEMERE